MRLRFVYRSYGGENMKNRPDWYSKTLALQSFLRAAEPLDGAEIVFLNDGPMPEERLALMRGVGEIASLPGVGMRGSYRAALRIPRQRGWAADDVVWFSEDDYLYAPEALVRLREAVEGHGADYFALYGDVATDTMYTAGEAPWIPRGWDAGPAVRVGEQDWIRTLSTTSTFGARVGALREDRSIFVQTLLPHRNMLRDHDLCVVYQGFEPHDWRQLGRDLVGRGEGGVKARVREAALAPFKAALNVRSHRRPSRSRVLLAAAPNLATHLELAWMAPGRDWELVAKETAEWAADR